MKIVTWQEFSFEGSRLVADVTTCISRLEGMGDTFVPWVRTLPIILLLNRGFCLTADVDFGALFDLMVPVACDTGTSYSEEPRGAKPFRLRV